MGVFTVASVLAQEGNQSPDDRIKNPYSYNEWKRALDVAMEGALAAKMPFESYLFSHPEAESDLYRAGLAFARDAMLPLKAFRENLRKIQVWRRFDPEAVSDLFAEPQAIPDFNILTSHEAVQDPMQVLSVRRIEALLLYSAADSIRMQTLAYYGSGRVHFILDQKGFPIFQERWIPGVVEATTQGAEAQMAHYVQLKVLGPIQTKQDVGLLQSRFDRWLPFADRYRMEGSQVLLDQSEVHPLLLRHPAVALGKWFSIKDAMPVEVEFCPLLAELRPEFGKTTADKKPRLRAKEAEINQFLKSFYAQEQASESENEVPFARPGEEESTAKQDQASSESEPAYGIEQKFLRKRTLLRLETEWNLGDLATLAQTKPEMILPQLRVAIQSDLPDEVKTSLLEVLEVMDWSKAKESSINDLGRAIYDQLITHRPEGEKPVSVAWVTKAYDAYVRLQLQQKDTDSFAFKVAFDFLYLQFDSEHSKSPTYPKAPAELGSRIFATLRDRAKTDFSKLRASFSEVLFSENLHSRYLAIRMYETLGVGDVGIQFHLLSFLEDPAWQAKAAYGGDLPSRAWFQEAIRDSALRVLRQYGLRNANNREKLKTIIENNPKLRGKIFDYFPDEVRLVLGDKPKPASGSGSDACASAF